MDENQRKAINSLLAARFGKAIFRSSDPILALSRVPAKHLRTHSNPFLPVHKDHPRDRKVSRRPTPLTSRTPTQQDPADRGLLRTASTPVTCRITTNKLSQELRRSCITARSSLQKERFLVQRQARSIHRGLRKCSLAVSHALKIDIHGFLPKALIVHRAKLRTQRLKSPPDSRAETESRKALVKEYRKALLNKALTKGIGKDMRYLYTCGTCSALGT